MEPVNMNSKFRSTRFYLQAIGVGLGGAALLTGCVVSPSESGTADGAGYAANAGAATASGHFSFPMATCGEQATEPSDVWYIVYVDNGDPDRIRSQYCKDAIGTLREGTGLPSVQVASFTDYSLAQELAQLVSGEVEEVTGDRTTSASAAPRPATPGSSTNPTSADPASSPATAGSRRSASTATASSSGSLVGETVYLSASDAGSLINVRESPSTTAAIQHSSQIGESVQVSDRVEGDDGYAWYKVSLPNGQIGWVRGDFVSQTPPDPTRTASRPSDSGTGSGYSSYAPDRYSSSSSSSSGSSSSGSSDRYAADRTSSDSASYSAPATDPSASRYAAEAEEPTSLTAVDPEARINIRDSASTTAEIRSTAYAGDPVQISDTTQGEDGYTWYYVEFESGDSGWVRGDYVSGQ